MSIVDTGAHRTVICTGMARTMGLVVNTEAKNYGKFSVPGSDAIHAYAGVVAGDTLLYLNERVLAKVNNLRVIQHPHPFMLLGSDVLRGGRPLNTWNFAALRVKTVGLNHVEASLEFEVAGQTITIPLPHAPAGAPDQDRTAIAEVSSGQCL